MQANKKTYSILSCTLLIVILTSLFFFLPKKSASSPQLINRCADAKKVLENPGPEFIKRNVKDDNLITVRNYSFEFPLSGWEKTEDLSYRFDEAIRFPRVLDSLHIAYPLPQLHPLFLRVDNPIFVALTLYKDNCVTAEEWFSKLPYATEYTKKYQTFNGKTWLIATRDSVLPMQTIAILHDRGYHYEFTIIVRDEKTRQEYQDLLPQILETFKPIAKK